MRNSFLSRTPTIEILHRIAKLRWLPVRHWFDLRQAMRLRVTIRDPDDGQRYRFIADSLHAYERARLHLRKEPETIKWLRQNLRPNDVFLDIGANIGTFSIFAAKHLSDEGHVYACEPHLPTTVQLLQNIAANEMQKRVSVISVAASGEDAFVPFRYKRWRQGASGSQLGVEGAPEVVKQVGTELKCGMRIDTMVARGVIRPPDLIKIDTDGIEIQILSGMKNLLGGDRRPRAILVEIQEGKFRDQVNLMKSFGYSLIETHLVGKWKRKFDRGLGLDQLAFNALFEPGVSRQPALVESTASSLRNSGRA
jgi:FkbM family methyltransferase